MARSVRLFSRWILSFASTSSIARFPSSTWTFPRLAQSDGICVPFAERRLPTEISPLISFWLPAPIADSCNTELPPLASTVPIWIKLPVSSTSRPAPPLASAFTVLTRDAAVLFSIRSTTALPSARFRKRSPFVSATWVVPPETMLFPLILPRPVLVMVVLPTTLTSRSSAIFPSSRTVTSRFRVAFTASVTRRSPLRPVSRASCAESNSPF